MRLWIALVCILTANSTTAQQTSRAAQPTHVPIEFVDSNGREDYRCDCDAWRVGGRPRWVGEPI